MESGAWLRELESRLRDEHFTVRQQQIGQHVPGDRTRIAAVNRELDGAAATPAKPENAMPKLILCNGITSTPQQRSAG